MEKVLRSEKQSCNNPIDQKQLAEIFVKCCNDICDCFEMDDSNRSLLNELFLYAIGKSQKLDIKKGLWLYGGIGTGKSTLIKILREYDSRINNTNYDGCLMGGFNIISASTVVNQFSRTGLDGIDKYCFKKLTCAFDEVGREPLPVKYYGTEMNVMQYIFQMRYDMRLDCRTHVTTNLLPEQILPKYSDYIADRINEMFNVVEITGKSRR